MEKIVFLLFFIGLAFLIAYFLGRKRQIGFGWSFYFCVFLTPIVGFIITMLSKKYYDPNPKPSKTLKIIGWILVVWCSLALLGQSGKLQSDPNNISTINGIFGVIGFIGVGAYLIQLSEGKNFNSKALTKKD
jgi:surface polysaccharide O-acyltransferase-like enzyme